jgi:hypothetical protein
MDYHFKRLIEVTIVNGRKLTGLMCYILDGSDLGIGHCRAIEVVG